ncbi:MAG: hypothetical protein P4K80_00950 [Acidobacteriaceae bacterium]|nr:hypothetical protein [Acidobacteriaceae bacterium]
MKKILGRIIIGLAVALMLLYEGDWALWRLHMAQGRGMGTVTVNTIIVMPLKDNKEEYDEGGLANVACSRSLFPQAGSGACWWLARHRDDFQR